MDNYIYTDNEGKLEELEGFNFLRGIENEGVKMGQAKNEQGEVFDIYPAPCNLGRCFCFATAVKINE